MEKLINELRELIERVELNGYGGKSYLEKFDLIKFDIKQKEDLIKRQAETIEYLKKN